MAEFPGSVRRTSGSGFSERQISDAVRRNAYRPEAGQDAPVL